MTEYKIVSPSSDPTVIGVKNGVYQVELKKGTSFKNKEEQMYYESFFNGKFTAFTLGNFQNVDLSKLTQLLYIPMKSAKETDFVRYSPYEMGLNFLVSQKVIDIIEKYSLGTYNKIPSSIKGFNNNYYTIGFPIITEEKINYPQSIFYHILQQKEYRNLCKNSYKSISGALVKSRKISLLPNQMLGDIANIEGHGIFFSTSLISQLLEKEIIGIEIGQTSLEAP